MEPKARRALPHRLERCGYLRVDNPNSNQGLWVIDDKRCAVYSRKDLDAAERLEAARERIGTH